MNQNKWKLSGFGRIAPSSQWRMKSHRHENPELIVILDGILFIKEPDGTSHKGSLGDIFIYPAGCWHEEESDKHDPVETIFFGFTGTTCTMIKSLDDVDGRIRNLSQWIWNSRQESYPNSPSINQAFFEAIGEEFLRLEHQPSLKTAFSDIRAFVHKNIDRTITLDDLAAHVNMSKFHFVREYKKRTGQSPMAYVRGVRIDEAKNLIRSTNLPLKSIADMVGFANEYQLSSIMRRNAKHPPSYFRRQGS